MLDAKSARRIALALFLVCVFDCVMGAGALVAPPPDLQVEVYPRREFPLAPPAHREHLGCSRCRCGRPGTEQCVP